MQEKVIKIQVGKEKKLGILHSIIGLYNIMVMRINVKM